MITTNDITHFSKDIKLLIAYPAHVFQPIIDISTILYNSFFDSDIEVELKAIPSTKDLNFISNQGIYSHIISINTHDYLEKEKTFSLDKPKITKLLAFNLEQTPIEEQCSYWASMRLNEVAFYGIYFDYIISESKSKITDIENLGFRTIHMNLPYHPSFDKNITHSIEDKKYDVCFIGCNSERRQSLINKLKEEKISLAPAPIPQALDSNYKRSLIQKSKICINVHFSNMEYFEKPRLFYDFFINKGIVITEKILYPEEFIHLKDIYMAKYFNLFPTILLILKKYNESFLKVGDSAYTKFKEMYSYEQIINNFIGNLLYKEMMFKRGVK